MQSGQRLEIQWEETDFDEHNLYDIWSIKFINALNHEEMIWVRHSLELQDENSSNTIHICLKSKRLHAKVKIKCNEKKLPIVSHDNFQIRLSVTDDDLMIVKEFLNVVEGGFPLPNDKQKKILDGLGFNKFKDLFSLIDQNKFDEAFRKASSIYDSDVMWKLGQYCESKLKYLDACQCYEQIPENNPHYREANTKTGEIMLRKAQIAHKYANNTISNKDKEDAFIQKREYQENAFRCFLRGGNTQRADQLFSELCGDSGQNPVIKNVNGDENMLLAMAKRFYSQERLIEDLKKKNQLLAEELMLINPEALEKSQEDEKENKSELSRISFLRRT